MFGGPLGGGVIIMLDLVDPGKPFHLGGGAQVQR